MQQFHQNTKPQPTIGNGVIVLATTNMHKIRELRSMLKKSFPKLDVLSLHDFPQYQPVEETGATFKENATLKAEHAASTLNCWALADDSGLVVPGIDGRPGIYSSRFAGLDATDKENREKLLKEMAHLQDTDRQAYFECCLAIAAPEGLKKCVCAVCEGTITTEERGRQGFGYDPIFLKYEYSKTFAELEEDVKNRISHRRKAFDKLLLALETVCAT